MWTLEKPDLEDAINDIKAIIAASKGELVDGDKARIKMIYQIYDKNNGNISKATNNILCPKQRKSLHNLYNETGIINKKPGKLYYIRKELFDKVSECPMCGMCPPQQLDHQMPQSEYESIAVLRLNLVPICSICNNKKRKKEAQDFVHPYYAIFPEDVIFLIANVHVDPRTLMISWSFDIDGTSINDDNLLHKVNNQISVIELFERLQKASNSYLSEMLYATYFESDEELHCYVEKEYQKSKALYGLNHWRTALLSALCHSPMFTYKAVNEFVINIKPINGGRNT